MQVMWFEIPVLLPNKILGNNIVTICIKILMYWNFGIKFSVIGNNNNNIFNNIIVIININ